MVDQPCPSSTSSDTHNLHIVTPLWIWFTVGVLICVIATVAALMISSSRESSKRTDCAERMRGICKALLICADKNKKGLAPDFGALVESGYISAEQLRCPNANQSNYMYITAVPSTTGIADTSLVKTRDFRAPLIYEPIENHHGEGGNIAFLDGHVKWHPKEKYEEILAAYKGGAVKVEIEGGRENQ